MSTRRDDGLTENSQHNRQLATYEVRVAGHLEDRWSAWFDGLALSPSDDGTTSIQGPLADQAALHGLLQKVRDLGLELISVTRLTPEQQGQP